MKRQKNPPQEGGFFFRETPDPGPPPPGPPPPPPRGGGGGGGLHFPCQPYLLFIYLSFSYINLFDYVVFSFVYFTYIVFSYSRKEKPPPGLLQVGGVEILTIYIYLRRLPNCVLPDRAYTTEAVGTTRFACALIS